MYLEKFRRYIIRYIPRKLIRGQLPVNQTIGLPKNKLKQSDKTHDELTFRNTYTH